MMSDAPERGALNTTGSLRRQCNNFQLNWDVSKTMNQGMQEPTAAEKLKISSIPLHQELLHRDNHEYQITTDISSELRVATLAYLSIQQ